MHFGMETHSANKPLSISDMASKGLCYSREPWDYSNVCRETISTNILNSTQTFDNLALAFSYIPRLAMSVT